MSFISCSAVKWNSELYKFQYKLIDTDFEDTAFEHTGIHLVDISAIIVDRYEERNLNVAKNLFIYYMQLYKYHNPFYKNNFISSNKLYNPRFSKYEEEFNKYLVLL